jgi:hypothetical protein
MDGDRRTYRCLGDTAPTGKAATFSGVNIYRFGPDGKVAEIWNHRDDVGVMEQLGAPVYADAAPATPTLARTTRAGPASCPRGRLSAGIEPQVEVGRSTESVRSAKRRAISA